MFCLFCERQPSIGIEIHLFYFLYILECTSMLQVNLILGQNDFNLQSWTKVLGRKHHFRDNPSPFSMLDFPGRIWWLILHEKPHEQSQHWIWLGEGGTRACHFSNSAGNSSNNGIRCEVKWWTQLSQQLLTTIVGWFVISLSLFMIMNTIYKEITYQPRLNHFDLKSIFNLQHLHGEMIS